MSHPIMTLFSSHLCWHRQYSRSSSSSSSMSSGSGASNFGASVVAPAPVGMADVEREREVDAAIAGMAASANRAGAFFVLPDDVTGMMSEAGVVVAMGAVAFAFDFVGAFARDLTGCFDLPAA